jgi:hypothetical protein
MQNAANKTDEQHTDKYSQSSSITYMTFRTVITLHMLGTYLYKSSVEEVQCLMSVGSGKKIPCGMRITYLQSLFINHYMNPHKNYKSVILSSEMYLLQYLQYAFRLYP